MMTAPIPSSIDTNTDGLAVRFSRAMAALGPFETAPHLAVAVSGGADSTALALLARDWAAVAGGRITALIVDHGLRAEAAAEAAETAGRLQALGISAEVLVWTGEKPATGVQAAARGARYRLLQDWCRDAGVLHLLTGHHADDQTETHVMREVRGGLLGAAGMSALVEQPEVRLLRPLLNFGRGDLAAHLARRGIAWIDDPSNADGAFERVRTRRRLAADPGLTEAARAGGARAGASRQVLEDAVNGALAEAVSLHPLGFADLDRRVLAELTGDVLKLTVQRLAQVLGGADHAPPGARAERLAGRLASDRVFPGASLGRCRILAERAGHVALCRDARGLPEPVAAVPGRISGWDGRFDVDIQPDLTVGLTLAPLGAEGWRQIAKGRRRNRGLTLAFARTLPALFMDGVLVGHALDGGEGGMAIRFRPKNSLAFNGFCIA